MMFIFKGQKINPGLGFRPQIDPEDELISYNPSIYETEKNNGLKQYFVDLKNFLESSKT